MWSGMRLRLHVNLAPGQNFVKKSPLETAIEGMKGSWREEAWHHVAVLELLKRHPILKVHQRLRVLGDVPGVWGQWPVWSRVSRTLWDKLCACIHAFLSPEQHVWVQDSYKIWFILLDVGCLAFDCNCALMVITLDKQISELSLIFREPRIRYVVYCEGLWTFNVFGIF